MKHRPCRPSLCGMTDTVFIWAAYFPNGRTGIFPLHPKFYLRLHIIRSTPVFRYRWYRRQGKCLPHTARYCSGVAFGKEYYFSKSHGLLLLSLPKPVVNAAEFPQTGCPPTGWVLPPHTGGSTRSLLQPGKRNTSCLRRYIRPSFRYIHLAIHLRLYRFLQTEEDKRHLPKPLPKAPQTQTFTDLYSK